MGYFRAWMEGSIGRKDLNPLQMDAIDRIGYEHGLDDRKKSDGKNVSAGDGGAVMGALMVVALAWMARDETAAAVTSYALGTLASKVARDFTAITPKAQKRLAWGVRGAFGAASIALTGWAHNEIGESGCFVGNFWTALYYSAAPLLGVAGASVASYVYVRDGLKRNVTWKTHAKVGLTAAAVASGSYYPNGFAYIANMVGPTREADCFAPIDLRRDAPYTFNRQFRQFFVHSHGPVLGHNNHLGTFPSDVGNLPNFDLVPFKGQDTPPTGWAGDHLGLRRFSILIRRPMSADQVTKVDGVAEGWFLPYTYPRSDSVAPPSATALTMFNPYNPKVMFPGLTAVKIGACDRSHCEVEVPITPDVAIYGLVRRDNLYLHSQNGQAAAKPDLSLQ